MNFTQETKSDATAPSFLESLVDRDYARCHPGDSFAALKRRARFSKEDKGLLADWLDLALRRHSAMKSRQIG